MGAVRGLVFLLAVVVPAAGLGFRAVSSAPFDQTKPAIAFDGTDFLVTWQDTRDIPTDTSANIYACRLDQSLAVLDSAGILIAGTREEDYAPTVAWGGADYLIAWQRGC